jgi:hypothetical protein
VFWYDLRGAKRVTEADGDGDTCRLWCLRQLAQALQQEVCVELKYSKSTGPACEWQCARRQAVETGHATAVSRLSAVSRLDAALCRPPVCSDQGSICEVTPDQPHCCCVTSRCDTSFAAYAVSDTAGGAGDTAGGALGHENSVGLAEQQLHSAMQQLGMSDGEPGAGCCGVMLGSGGEYCREHALLHKNTCCSLLAWVIIISRHSGIGPLCFSSSRAPASST